MNTRRQILTKIVRWSIFLLCTAYIVRFFALNTDDIMLVTRLKPLAVTGIVVLSALAHLIFCFRFQAVLKKCTGKSVPFFHWLRLVVLGRFLTLLTPQAGNVYSSIMLKKHYGIPHTRYISSFFSFVWTDTCVNVLVAMVLVLLVQPQLTIGGISAIYLLVGIFLVVFLVPVIIEWILSTMTFNNPRLVWIHGRLSEMFGISMGNIKDPAFMAKFLAGGLLAFADAIGVFYICFRSLDLPVSIPALALFYVVMRLSTLIVLTPGNLGVREIAYGIIGKNLNITMGQGILISMIIRVIATTVIIALGALLGGIDLFRHRKNLLKQAD